MSVEILDEEEERTVYHWPWEFPFFLGVLIGCLLFGAGVAYIKYRLSKF